MKYGDALTSKARLADGEGRGGQSEDCETGEPQEEKREEKREATEGNRRERRPHDGLEN
jgi:hypothetical protein